jgi:hypothetical protein
MFAGLSSRILRYLLEFDVPQMQYTLEAESFKVRRLLMSHPEDFSFRRVIMPEGSVT